MSSRARRKANRLNAQKSTGPRTAEGKAKVRFNALKTGVDAQSEVLPTENPAALAALASEYYARWNPRSPETRALIDICVRSEWLLARLSRVEPSLYSFVVVGDDKVCPTDFKEGRFVQGNCRELDHLQRRLNATQRNLRTALKDLRIAKAAEQEDEAAQSVAASAESLAEAAEPPEISPESAPPPPVQTQSAQSATAPEPEIGFVPEESNATPAADAKPAPILSPELQHLAQRIFRAQHNERF